ncbi:MAG: 2-dehydropantoate 2-reductase [Rhodoferax sp.]
MRICIAGAGAIGSLIGYRLAGVEGLQVSALARGATLAALREHGWRMDPAQGLPAMTTQVSDRAHDLGPQDLVVVAVKGPSLPALADALGPLMGPQTVVMPAMNGVPWWFCKGLAPFDAQPLQSVDPGGTLERLIATPRVVGCVVHASAKMQAPGVVEHSAGNGLIVGEPAGGKSARAQQIVELLGAAGFQASHSDNIRYDIWYKLWGNMTMNPVSALTGATTDLMLGDPLVRAFCSAVMREADTIGARIGCPIAQSAEDRQVMTSKLGAIKTSMLQDVEAGRPIELDALVASVQEIGQRLGLVTPNIDALLGLTRLFGRMRGLY